MRPRLAVRLRRPASRGALTPRCLPELNGGVTCICQQRLCTILADSTCRTAVTFLWSREVPKRTGPAFSWSGATSRGYAALETQLWPRGGPRCRQHVCWRTLNPTSALHRPKRHRARTHFPPPLLPAHPAILPGITALQGSAQKHVPRDEKSQRGQEAVHEPSTQHGRRVSVWKRTHRKGSAAWGGWAVGMHRQHLIKGAAHVRGVYRMRAQQDQYQLGPGSGQKRPKAGLRG